jgi:hypothetical protein
MENKECFPSFHGYNYLFESVQGICCTWSLNPPIEAPEEMPIPEAP